MRSRPPQIKVAFVTAPEKSWIFPFLLRLVVCTRMSQGLTASKKHLRSPLLREKRFYDCKIRQFSQRQVDLVLVAALSTRREWKMVNDSTAQKGKKQRSSGSTTGNEGVNKDGSSHKNCDENTSSHPSTNSKERMAGKSANNEGSEQLKFGSMLAVSITDLKETMAGTFD